MKSPSRPGWSDPPTGGAIGIVISQDFPEDKLHEELSRGIQLLGTKRVWVCLNEPRANHASRFVANLLRDFDIEPIYAPLNPYWLAKREEHGYDLRAGARETELRATCERIVVFHVNGSQSTKDWLKWQQRDLPYDPEKWPCYAKITVVTAGKVKPKRRPGRKPRGA